MTRTSGRGWAYLGAGLGGIVSIAANVAHSYVPKPDAAPDWAPHAGAVAMATFWPVALFVGVEILARVAWPVGGWWTALRFGGLLPVASVAALVSYRHLAGLLAFYGEDGLTASLGPLAVDGLMVMSTGALLATIRRTTAEPVAVATVTTVVAATPEATLPPRVVVPDALPSWLDGFPDGDDTDTLTRPATGDKRATRRQATGDTAATNERHGDSLSRDTAATNERHGDSLSRDTAATNERHGGDTATGDRRQASDTAATRRPATGDKRATRRRQKSDTTGDTAATSDTLSRDAAATNAALVAALTSGQSPSVAATSVFGDKATRSDKRRVQRLHVALLSLSRDTFQRKYGVSLPDGATGDNNEEGDR